MTEALEIFLTYTDEINKYLNDYLISIGLEPDCKLYHRNDYIDNCDYLSVVVDIKMENINLIYVNERIELIKQKTNSYDCIINAITDKLIYDFYVKEEDFLKWDLIRSMTTINKFKL